MTIDIQILTTTAAILDADGRTGVGTIRIRPNQPFQYNDGVTDIQVTDAVVEIAVSGGQLQSALTLAPNTGASNVPSSTYYIVEVDVNTITYTEFWRLSNTPTSLEWGEITRLANQEDAGGDLLTAHIQASNPHRGYLLRSDTVDAAATGTVSDGRGAIPRLDPSSGKLPASFVPSTYDAFPSGTKILFSGTLPTGWTQDTAAALNGAMLVGTTGVPTSGNSADPRTMAHTHTIAHTHNVATSNHTHTFSVPNHTHAVDGSGVLATLYAYPTAGSDTYIYNSLGNNGYTASDGSHSGSTGSDGGETVASSASSAANSGSTSINPKYYEVMIGVKA